MVMNDFEYSITKALAERRLIPLAELTKHIEYPIPTYVSREFWESPDIRQDEERLYKVLNNHRVMTLPEIESGKTGQFRGSCFNPDATKPYTPFDWMNSVTSAYRVYPTQDGGRFLIITDWEDAGDNYVQPIAIALPDYIM